MTPKKLATTAVIVAVIGVLLGIVAAEMGKGHTTEVQAPAATQPLVLGEGDGAADASTDDQPNVLPDPQDPQNPQDGPDDLGTPNDPKPNPHDGPKDLGTDDDTQPDPTPKPNNGPKNIGL